MIILWLFKLGNESIKRALDGLDVDRHRNAFSRLTDRMVEPFQRP